MTTKARIERTGQGGKYAVRVTVESDGLRFAITSGAGTKTHASAVLPANDSKAVAAFIVSRLHPV
jgi:hypothetical protein